MGEAAASETQQPLSRHHNSQQQRSCELVMGLAVRRNRNFAADLRTTTQQGCFNISKQPGGGVWSARCLSSFVSAFVTTRPLPTSGELEATKNLHLLTLWDISSFIHVGCAYHAVYWAPSLPRMKIAAGLRLGRLFHLCCSDHQLNPRWHAHSPDRNSSLERIHRLDLTHPTLYYSHGLQL